MLSRPPQATTTRRPRTIFTCLPPGWHRRGGRHTGRPRRSRGAGKAADEPQTGVAAQALAVDPAEVGRQRPALELPAELMRCLAARDDRGSGGSPSPRSRRRRPCRRRTNRTPAAWKEGVSSVVGDRPTLAVRDPGAAARSRRGRRERTARPRNRRGTADLPPCRDRHLDMVGVADDCVAQALNRRIEALAAALEQDDAQLRRDQLQGEDYAGRTGADDGDVGFQRSALSHPPSPPSRAWKWPAARAPAPGPGLRHARGPRPRLPARFARGGWC